MRWLVAVVMSCALVGTGCVSQAQKRRTHASAGAKAVGGGALAVLGGVIIIKVQSDDENDYNTDKLFTGIGTLFVIVGLAGLLVYGAAWAATSPDPPPPAPPPPPPPAYPAPTYPPPTYPPPTYPPPTYPAPAPAPEPQPPYAPPHPQPAPAPGT